MIFIFLNKFYGLRDERNVCGHIRFCPLRFDSSNFVLSNEDMLRRKLFYIDKSITRIAAK
jgi:hypothetical protein